MKTKLNLTLITLAGLIIFAGATGQGHFNITSNVTPCNRLTLPAQVTFQGVLIRQ
jgi:hypothetical protein